MSSEIGAHEGGSASSGELVRVWPSLVNRGLWFVGILVGAFVVVATIANGYLFLAPLGLLLIFLTARLIGWVEIQDGELRNRELMGETQTVAFSDIREVGLGMHQVRNSKWWYPEVETLAGASVKLLSLKSYSGTETIARVEQIFATCMEYMPKEEEDQFRTVTATEVGELELSPGYDAYLREQANNPEPESAQTPTPVVEQPTTQVPTTRRQPHLTLVDANSTDEPDEDAPEVFTPQPMVDRRNENKLTVVTEEFVERVEDRREVNAEPPSPEADKSVEEEAAAQLEWQRAAIAMLASNKPAKKKLPPVVIETPTAAKSKSEGEESSTQFTSLFRRAA